MQTASYTVDIVVGDHCIYFAKGEWDRFGYFTPLQQGHMRRVQVLAVEGEYATIAPNPNSENMPTCCVHIRRLLPGPGEGN